MVRFKLRYLSNFRGRGEVARYLFALADQEFENDLIDRAEFQKHKSTTPFGQLPVLEVDGVQICQSNAINRFLANKFGFAGQTEMDKARVDMIVDCTEDLLFGFVAYNVMKLSDEDRNKKKEEYTRIQLPEFLAKLEKLLKQNNNGSGFFVGDTITWADLAVYHWCTDLPNYDVEVSYDGLPVLKAFISRVEANPRIADYLKKRDTAEKL